MKKQKTNEKRRTSYEITPYYEMKCGFLGFASSCAVAVIMILIFPLIALMFTDTDGAGRIMGYAALYISALIGGIVAGSLCKGKSLLCGCTAGGAFLLLTFLLSLFTSGEGLNPLISILLRLPLVVLSCFGSYIAVQSKSAAKRKNRRKRA